MKVNLPLWKEYMWMKTTTRLFFFCKLKSQGCTINMNVKYWCTWQHFFKPVIYCFLSFYSSQKSNLVQGCPGEPSLAVWERPWQINTHNTHVHAHVKMDTFESHSHTALRMMSTHKATLRHFGLTSLILQRTILTPYGKTCLNSICFHHISFPFLACMFRAGLF